MRLIYNIFLLFLVLIGLSFASLNAQTIHFNYYFGEINIQLSLLLVLVLAIGILIGIGASLVSWVILKHENFKLKIKLKTVSNDRVIKQDIFLAEK